MNRLVIVFIIAVFGGVWLSPIHNLRAEETPPEKVSNIVKVYEAIAKYPAPSWLKPSTNPMDQSEYYRDQKGPTFILEQIPKGEKFESWTQLYAVAAYYSKQLTMKDFVIRSLGVYYTICGKENFFAQPLEKTEDGATTYLILCQNSAKSDGSNGYGDGVGEVTLMAFRNLKDTYVKVYHHWRGKAFNIADQGTWPVAKPQLQEMARRMKSVSLVPDISGN